MKECRHIPKAHLQALALLTFALIVTGEKHSDLLAALKSQKLNHRTISTAHTLEANFFSRSKRNVADLLVTNRASREKAHRHRRALLYQLLKKADTATGKRCSCFFDGQRSRSKTCDCNISELLLTLLRKLNSPEQTNNSFNAAIQGLDYQTRSQIIHLVVTELKRSYRARAAEKIRLRHLRRRILRRRRLARKYPRSVFDGKQLVFF